MASRRGEDQVRANTRINASQKTNMPNPSVSVVIPTRDRPHELRWSLRTLVDQDYPNLEIIVSDNGIFASARPIVQELTCKRVRYVRPSAPLAMTEHWNFALGHTTGDWVSVIGDDDGLVCNAVTNMVAGALAHKVQLVRTSQATFRWPEGQERGVLLVPQSGKTHVRDSRRALSAVLAGRAGYQSLPVIYNGGLVARSALQAMQAEGGALFRASSPDVYSGFALASLIPRYLFIDEPLSVSGSSIHSTGRSLLGHGGRRSQLTTGTPSNDFLASGSLALHSKLGMCSDGTYPPIMQAAVLDSYYRTSWCRPGESDGADYLAQIALCESEADWHDPLAVDWLRRFAFTCGSTVPTRSLSRHVRLVGRRLMRARHLLRSLLAVRHHAENVYEASQIVKSRPWKAGSCARSVVMRSVRRIRKSADH